MNLITGYRGEPHITAAQDGYINYGVYGTANIPYILPMIGDELALSIISANEVRVGSGVLMADGRAAVIEPGSYDSITIENGSQGYKRIDAIAATYRKAGDGTESMTLEVVQGTPTTGSPVAPEVTSGRIIEGDTIAQFVIGLVNIDGITISSVTKTIGTGSSVMDNANRIKALEQFRQTLTGETIPALETDIASRIKRIASGSIANGASKRFWGSESQTTFGILVIMGTTAARKGIYLVSNTTNGTSNIVAVKAAGSGVTVTEQTNGFNIENDSSSSIYAYWLTLLNDPIGW